MRRERSGGRGRLGRLGQRRGRLLRRRGEMEAARLRHRGGRRGVWLLCGLARVCGVVGRGGRPGGGDRAFGAETGGQRAELVEDLNRFVVDTWLRQHLDRGRQCLARAGGRAEPGLRIRLQKTGEDLPQRFRDALRGAGGAVRGEVFDECPGVRLLPCSR